MVVRSPVAWISTVRVWQCWSPKVDGVCERVGRLFNVLLPACRLCAHPLRALISPHRVKETTHGSTRQSAAGDPGMPCATHRNPDNDMRATCALLYPALAMRGTADTNNAQAFSSSTPLIMSGAVQRIVRVHPQNTALFVCDLQERFASAIASWDHVISISTKVLKAAQILNLPVYATEQAPKGVCARLTMASATTEKY